MGSEGSSAPVRGAFVLLERSSETEIHLHAKENVLTGACRRSSSRSAEFPRSVGADWVRISEQEGGQSPSASQPYPSSKVPITEVIDCCNKKRILQHTLAVILRFPPPTVGSTGASEPCLLDPS